MKRKEVESCTILLTLTGSRLYGIDNLESDYDYKGICIPPVQYFFGDSNFEQLDSFVDPDCLYPILTNTDSQIYNLKKYVHLALLNNPNILELLWVAPEHYIVRTSLADRLIALRELFLSTKVYNSYSGYAISQIKRVRTHRGWLQAYHANSDFFNTPPNPKDYGLEENPLRKEQLNAFLEFLYILIDDAAQYHTIRDEIFQHIDFKGALKQYRLQPEILDAVQYYTRSTDDFIHLLHSTQSYRQAKQEYDAFHSWKANRNSKRAAIEEKCGYDCYADDTEFLTVSGWKLYKDISNEEEIGTFNTITQRLEFQKPLDRCEFDSPEYLCLLSNRYSECLVTYNHNLFVSKFTRKPSNNYSDCYYGNLFELTTPHFLKDFHILNSLEPSPTGYNVDNDYLEIMAAYVTEGTINKRKNKNETVCKALHIEQKEGNRLQPWLDSMVEKGLFKKYKSEKLSREHDMPDYYGNIYVMLDRDLCERLVSDCGEGSKFKKLPSWTMFLSQTQVLRIIDVMMNADGTNKKMGRVLYTSSIELANSFQTMCICAGIKCVIWEYLNLKGGFDKTHDMYQVYVPYDISRFSSVRGIRNLKQVKSPTSKVVCFTTENNTLVTRRNFKVAFHGNSKHSGHAFRLLKSGIEILNGEGVIPDRRGIDADYIRSIRNGAVEYDELMEQVDRLMIDLETAKNNTKLPRTPDRRIIEEEVVSIIKEYLL